MQNLEQKVLSLFNIIMLQVVTTEFYVKGSLKCLGTHSIIQSVEVISTETGRQGGT